MKYWRGYLVAAVIALCGWGLLQFAASHVALVDMIYPYSSRMVMEYMASWSAGFDGLLWQVLLVIGVALLLCSIVLMIILRWNPIQWFGWVLVAVSVVFFLHTGMYGLNQHTSPIQEDIRLEVNEPSAATLEEAAIYYRDKANELADQVSRNPDGTVKLADFEGLAFQAADGFHYLTYERTYPIFSGSLEPVKPLGWADVLKERGITAITVPLTGESAVNAKLPAVGLPIAICKEMARRMAIYSDVDAEFAAFLACRFNSSQDFQYCAYVMAYRYCYNALASVNTSYGREAASRVRSDANKRMLKDIEALEGFLGAESALPNDGVCKLLVSWHIQEVVIPRQEAESEANKEFDPMDETDDRLKDIVEGTA